MCEVPLPPQGQVRPFASAKGAGEYGIGYRTPADTRSTHVVLVRGMIGGGGGAVRLTGASTSRRALRHQDVPSARRRRRLKAHHSYSVAGTHVDRVLRYKQATITSIRTMEHTHDSME